jgi:hypothetical protein
MPTDYLEIPPEHIHLRPDELSGLYETMGGQRAADEGEIIRHRLHLRVGRCPDALPLRALTLLKQTDFAEEYRPVLRGYEPWVVFYSVGIQDSGAFFTVARFGLRVRLLDKPRASVRSVFPETRLLDLGSGEIKFQTSIGVTGHLDKSIVAGVAVPDFVSANLPNIDISSSGEADVALNLRFSVLTPNIVATGVHDDESAWTLTQGPSGLLRGDQIVGHVLLLPRYTRSPLRVRATLFADIGLLSVLTFRYQSEPVDLDIPLLDPDSSQWPSKLSG